MIAGVIAGVGVMLGNQASVGHREDPERDVQFCELIEVERRCIT